MRARLPQYFRAGAIGVLILTVLAIGIGFYRARNKIEFRMKGFPTALSKDVVAEVQGYERRETEGDIVKYYIKADKATTYADNHQDLENVFLQVFDPGGGSSDQITAAKAVYIPEENKNFTAYFAGDVNIATRDSLNVRTEQVTYKKSDETATAEEQVSFDRENVHGSSFGAVVNVPAKRLELLKDVRIEAFESAGSSNKQATIESGYAAYDQQSEEIELRDGVTTSLASPKTNADTTSRRAHVYLSKNSGGAREARKLELFDNVKIASRQGQGKPTNISANYGVYEKDVDRFSIRGGVNIVTLEDEKPTTITADSAVYEQQHGKIFVDGNGQISQEGNLIKGDHITAELYPTKKLKNSIVRGNGFLRQVAPERTTEITAPELNASFGENQQLVNANAIGNGTAVLIPTNAVDYSKVTMSAASAIRAFFKGEGQIDRMLTEGRPTIQLDAPGGKPDAANKRVTADTVRTFFDGEGKNLQKAEAVGDAELFVEPLQARPENYKTSVSAPRFDCDFYPTGNNARTCTASTKTKTVRVPTVSSQARGTQTLLSDKLVTSFNQESRDIEKLDAAGNAKFTELDRNAASEGISFTQADEIVRLRGGEPTAWDSRARAKAKEIDWDTRNDRSALRGGVSSTYYSQKQSGGATPFGQGDKPVYITADNGDFDHRGETATFNGNARGWQENNYVRAESFYVQQREGQFTAEGSVQSLLYNAKRRENGRESNVPVYASARRMTYNRDNRMLHYETDVDIRQGTDRLVGGSANVYLDEKSEVARTDIENNVVITQPNRRAVGDYAQYVAANQSVVLRGNPARVQDAENGTSESGQLTVFLDQNRIVSEGKTKQNSSGRTRSVYKVKED
jgi:LPS export ABC transporter protein LptC